MILKDGQETRAHAAAIIAAGGIISFRTDTFYGLGADPLNPVAVSAIRELKGREEAKPILLLIADEHDVDRFIAERSALFDRVCQRHWPGPLTLIGKARPELPDELTAESGTVGIRLPVDQEVRELVRICGGALTATSANLTGKPPARTAAAVALYFPNGTDLIIDSGEALVMKPSTVLDLSGREPRILRQGVITQEELAWAIAG